MKIAPSANHHFQQAKTQFKAKLRERELLSVLIYRAAAVSTPHPLLSISVSLPFISRCNQLWLSEVFLTADFTGCKVTCLLFFRAERRLPGSRPPATCTRIMHTTSSTYCTFNSCSHANTPLCPDVSLQSQVEKREFTALKESLRQILLRKR